MSNALVAFPDAGCVVEFMQGNAPQIAWVLENQNGKTRLLLPNRRETAMQATRLLPWLGPQLGATPSREAALEQLSRHAARREALTEAQNPVEWWELAQGELTRAPAVWFAELAGDGADADLVAACGRALLACKTHFKFQSPDFEIYDAETVERRQTEQAREAERELLYRQGAAFARALWDGFLKKSPPPAPEALKSLAPDVLESMRTMLLTRISEPETQADLIWRTVTKGLPDDPHLALHLAQAWGLVGPHHNIWLDRAGYDAGDGWAAPLTDEIAKLARATLDCPLPAVDTPFISIDNASTRDIDDAFALTALPGGGWRLTLALACPALAWTFGGALDTAVRRRATSLYLPEGTSHMLPEALGTGACSLFQGEARPALIVTCEVAPDGELLTCAPSTGQVTLTANFTYADCEAALHGAPAADNPAAPHAALLRQALALAEARQACRIRHGAVIIERPELEILLHGAISERNLRVELRPEPPVPHAHLLVAEQMIVANAALARWAAEQNMALLFRTQDIQMPAGSAGLWTDPVQVAGIVRLLAPACMETTPRRHVGVGEAMYAPTTSPLRRYPDLLNEAQMLHLLRHGTPRWSRAELDALLVPLNARLDAATLVQRLRVRYWKLLYLRQQGDIWWPGVLTDANDAFATVNLPHEQVLVRGRRRMFGDMRVGQAVEVRLGNINPLLGDIMLQDVREREAERDKALEHDLNAPDNGDGGEPC